MIEEADGPVLAVLEAGLGGNIVGGVHEAGGGGGGVEGGGGAGAGLPAPAVTRGGDRRGPARPQVGGQAVGGGPAIGIRILRIK